MARKSKSVLSQSDSNYRPHRVPTPTFKSELHTDSVAYELDSTTTDPLTFPSSSSSRIFNPATLSSDYRNSKLSPSPTLSSVTPRSYLSSHRHHVLHLNERQLRPNSVPNQRNGLQNLDKSSQSPSTLTGSPTTSSHPVFHNVNDLAAHHGIPMSLPPTPRTVTRRTSPTDEMTPSAEDESFSSLCSEYLTMLDSTPNTASVEEATQAILNIFRAGTPDHVPFLTHQESLTICGCPPDPQTKPSEDFLTSPMEESPFDDFLSTPALGGDFQDFTSPLIFESDDVGAPYHHTPLFDDVGLFEPPSSSDKRTAPHLSSAVDLDRMYTVSPGTPALDASPFFPPSHRLPFNLPTGTRKNLTPETLIPLDAPVQSRNYLTPSVTSRKESSRKRSRTEASFDDDDEADKEVGELDAVAAKRLQNTLAARRSRRRKLEHQLELETNLDREKQLKEQWRSRAMTLEALLMSHGIPVPPAVPY
jgi:hypothetical protein